MVMAALVLSLAAAGADRALEAKVASVLPKPEEERWLQIPWRLSVMAARAESQRLGKPMFFWVMNGNPMGCT